MRQYNVIAILKCYCSYSDLRDIPHVVVVFFSSDVLANGVKYHRLVLDPTTLIRETGTCVCFNDVFLQVWCFVYWNQIPSLIIYDQSYSTPSCYLISYQDSSCKCQYFMDPMPHHMHTVRLCCASFSCACITDTVVITLFCRHNSEWLSLISPWWFMRLIHGYSSGLLHIQSYKTSQYQNHNRM